MMRENRIMAIYISEENLMSKVFWITGLAGAGKTTIGSLFYEKLKTEQPNTVFLDGDTLRKVFGNDLGYSKEDRRKCGMRYSKLCQLLQKQEINVICCTIAMFDSIREWNRENILEYKEIYLKVSMDTLRKRDQKGLYSNAAKGMDNEVVGIQVDVELPKNPDLILKNDGEKTPKEQVEAIWKYFIEDKDIINDV